MKNLWKMNQKSIKIRSKMDQTSIKNRSKSRFGRLQGRFGGVLGRLGRSKASLAAFWSVLEASWRALGRAGAEKGGQHGSNLALKTELKSIKNWSQNWSIFKCILESIFGRILVDFGCQNEAKMGSKIDVNFEGRFFKKPCFSLGKTMIFEIQEVQVENPTCLKTIKNGLQNIMYLEHRFLIDFGGFWFI